MPKINCDVCNCSHNKDGVCFSNRIDIGGMNSSTSNDTCCGAFLDRLNYSDLTNNTNSEGPCDCLVCKVNNCAYNENTLCTLSSINVSGSDVKIYSETNCASFEKQ